MRASLVSQRGLRRFFPVVVTVTAVMASIVSLPANPASAATPDVLILGPTTVPANATGLEATTATGVGLTVDIATNGNWSTKPYGSYKAIVLGDPQCGSPASTTPITAAIANAATWGAAVTGNVVIIGTDPTAHQSQGGAQLWKSAIAFAAAGPGTGAVIDLSCYYDYGGAPTPTTVPWLGAAFGGTFTLQQTSCGTTPTNAAHIVAASPALTGLTDAILWMEPLRPRGLPGVAGHVPPLGDRHRRPRLAAGLHRR